MYEQSLIQAGLSQTQAVVYEALIKNGPLPAGKLAKKTPFKRGLVYLGLEDLIKLDLVEKKEENNQAAVFQVKHPTSLQSLAEKREQQAKDAKLALEGVLPSIVSDFNLISGRPGVLFYEGEEGIKKTLEDSLSSKTEIYTYADPETIVKYADKINKDYVKKRNKLGIKKKIVMLDSEFARKYMKTFYKDITDVRFIDHKPYPFNAITEIYDRTTAYVTLEEKNKIGVIIKNESIYKMQKSLFEFIWNHAEEIKL
jgi:sugar-specific transcriptional regulator TrmB